MPTLELIAELAAANERIEKLEEALDCLLCWENDQAKRVKPCHERWTCEARLIAASQLLATTREGEEGEKFNESVQ